MGVDSRVKAAKYVGSGLVFVSLLGLLLSIRMCPANRSSSSSSNSGVLGRLQERLRAARERPPSRKHDTATASGLSEPLRSMVLNAVSASRSTGASALLPLTDEERCTYLKSDWQELARLSVASGSISRLPLLVVALSRMGEWSLAHEAAELASTVNGQLETPYGPQEFDGNVRAFVDRFDMAYFMMEPMSLGTEWSCASTFSERASLLLSVFRRVYSEWRDPLVDPLLGTLTIAVTGLRRAHQDPADFLRAIEAIAQEKYSRDQTLLSLIQLLDLIGNLHRFGWTSDSLEALRVDLDRFLAQAEGWASAGNLGALSKALGMPLRSASDLGRLRPLGPLFEMLYPPTAAEENLNILRAVGTIESGMLRVAAATASSEYRSRPSLETFAECVSILPAADPAAAKELVGENWRFVYELVAEAVDGADSDGARERVLDEAEHVVAENCRPWLSTQEYVEFLEYIETWRLVTAVERASQ